ncbi:hypothetical protein GCM10007905_35880 [Mixta theicola]|nr:hypothetical protein GCM10007905_35880 [Mixta theicola]
MYLTILIGFVIKIAAKIKNVIFLTGKINLSKNTVISAIGIMLK